MARKYRHELKYYISIAEYHMLKSLLNGILVIDGQGEGYSLRSLYFDDMYSTALKEKEDGVFARNKYRLRIYNMCHDDIIKFECKKKHGDYISKSSFNITREQANALIHKGEFEFLTQIDKPLAGDIYRMMKTRLMRPAVIVDYDREAYIAAAGNVRITFDKDVSAVVDTFDIFEENAARISVVEKGRMILEVKYDDYLPKHIKRILNLSRLERSAISKFVMCRRAYLAYKPVPVYVNPSVNL